MKGLTITLGNLTALSISACNAPVSKTDTTGMTNTLNVTYECDHGGDLLVRYAGVSDVKTSTAAFNVNGVEVKLPRKDDVWDDGTYILRGDNEISLANADVFVYQHVAEKVNGVDTPAEKIIMKSCKVTKATP